MKLSIEIELDNAAFLDDADEIGRILSDVAERLPFPLRDTGGALSLHDCNGNWVGSAEIAEEADARLIAAAPDLLEAAMRLTQIRETDTGNIEVGPVGWAQLQDAIAKATE